MRQDETIYPVLTPTAAREMTISERLADVAGMQNQQRELLEVLRLRVEKLEERLG